MKKLNKLIITEMLLNEVPCTVCAIVQDQKVIELRLEPSGEKNTLNNIYVGQVENIAANIQAAFVRLSDSVNGYLPLNQCTNATQMVEKQISPCVLETSFWFRSTVKP